MAGLPKEGPSATRPFFIRLRHQGADAAAPDVEPACKGSDMRVHSRLIRTGVLVLRGILCRGISFPCVAALLFMLSSQPLAQAQESDIAAASALVGQPLKSMEMLITSGMAPALRLSHVDISVVPGAGTTWLADGMADFRSRNKETLRASGKILIAGGLGKNVAVISAELYDESTDTWLVQRQLSTGRGQSSMAVPNNGRMLLWTGIVFPF